jgi:RHS repeat-associated protein
MAKVNPFTFQTEYCDWETDKIYWKNRYYDPSPSKWLSRDPLTEPGFYLLATGHQASENSSLSDGDSDSPNLNDFLTAGGPNAYAFVDNDPVNQIDGLGLIIIAFYGADYWGSGENGGANPEIRQIAADVGAVGPYRSLDIWDPYQYLLNYFRNGPGRCGNEPIKIFGHSWGCISAVKLSRWLGRSELRNHEIDVYTIDPVSLLRTRPISVPSAVTYFWNRYQTTGGPVLGPIALHGRYLPSHAKNGDSDEKELFGVDHLSIVGKVKAELEQKLKQ